MNKKAETATKPTVDPTQQQEKGIPSDVPRAEWEEAKATARQDGVLKDSAPASPVVPELREAIKRVVKNLPPDNDEDYEEISTDLIQAAITPYLAPQSQTQAPDAEYLMKKGTIYFYQRGPKHPEHRGLIMLENGRHAHLILPYYDYDAATQRNVYRLGDIRTGEMS